MKQADSFTYRVTKGERVLVSVASVGFAPPRASASCPSAQPKEAHPSANSVTWEFLAANDPGFVYLLRIRFEFPPGVDADASYHVRTSGDEKTGFDVTDFHAEDGNAIEITYAVVKA